MTCKMVMNYPASYDWRTDPKDPGLNSYYRATFSKATGITSSPVQETAKWDAWVRKFLPDAAVLVIGHTSAGNLARAVNEEIATLKSFTADIPTIQAKINELIGEEKILFQEELNLLVTNPPHGLAFVGCRKVPDYADDKWWCDNRWYPDWNEYPFYRLGSTLHGRDYDVICWMYFNYIAYESQINYYQSLQALFDNAQVAVELQDYEREQQILAEAKAQAEAEAEAQMETELLAQHLAEATEVVSFLESEIPVIANSLSIASTNLETYAGAIIDYEKAVEIDPSYAPVLEEIRFNAIIVEERVGFFSTVLDIYEAALLQAKDIIALQSLQLPLPSLEIPALPPAQPPSPPATPNIVLAPQERQDFYVAPSIGVPDYVPATTYTTGRSWEQVTGEEPTEEVTVAPKKKVDWGTVVPIGIAVYSVLNM